MSLTPVFDELKPRLNFDKIGKEDFIRNRIIALKQAAPVNFLNSWRFDIAAKHIYARFWGNMLTSNWGNEVYSQHIRAFNGYNEEDSSGKIGFEKFKQAYDELLESIQKCGFDDTRTVVPVTKEAFLLDGAHRIAACLYHKKDVTVLEVDMPKGEWGDHLFFRHKGLPEKYMDAIALEFCRLHPNAYTAVVFPSAQGKDKEVIDILQSHGQIFYSKNVYLNKRGGLNLIREIYHGEPWAGDIHTISDGIKNKANACFSRSGAVRLYVYTSDSLEQVKEAKQRIRDLYKIENHSVHMNDTKEQAVDMAQILLNQNSVHFLCHSHVKPFRTFQKNFGLYRGWLAVQKLENEHFCLDGSATLAAYGLRDAGDLDFLHFGYEGIETAIPHVSSHNSELHHHVLTKDDIIFNPENHFYHLGVKFISLKALRLMKTKRGERKDKSDVRNINRRLFLSSISDLKRKYKRRSHPV